MPVIFESAALTIPMIDKTEPGRISSPKKIKDQIIRNGKTTLRNLASAQPTPKQVAPSTKKITGKIRKTFASLSERFST